MKKKHKKAREKESRKGFTLIEIMVVVMIIGMLATVVSVGVMDYLSEAKRKTAVQQIKALEEALNFYKMHNDVYPTTEQGLEALVQEPTSPPVPRNYKSGGYIDHVPLDPWGNEYVYRSEDGKAYIESYGADGKDGGEGDNADIESWNLQAER
ncbi:MAG: type II secretion system major pseudopilin GspG [bacterium]